MCLVVERCWWPRQHEGGSRECPVLRVELAVLRSQIARHVAAGSLLSLSPRFASVLLGAGGRGLSPAARRRGRRGRRLRRRLRRRPVFSLVVGAVLAVRGRRLELRRARRGRARRSSLPLPGGGDEVLHRHESSVHSYTVRVLKSRVLKSLEGSPRRTGQLGCDAALSLRPYRTEKRPAP